MDDFTSLEEFEDHLLSVESINLLKMLEEVC